MARVVSRGEIWKYRLAAPDKRRPVVVLTRQEVIGLLHTVMVAPITSTIYGAPSEVLVGTGGRVETSIRGQPGSRADRGSCAPRRVRRNPATCDYAVSMP